MTVSNWLDLHKPRRFRANEPGRSRAAGGMVAGAAQWRRLPAACRSRSPAQTHKTWRVCQASTRRTQGRIVIQLDEE